MAAISLTVTFGDGSVIERKVNNYATDDKSFINLISRSFDIPDDGLSEKDKDTIKSALREIIGGKTNVAITLEALRADKHQKKFDNIIDFFTHYLGSTKMRAFWINYSTWQDFWDKIKGIFIDNKQYHNKYTKLVKWNLKQTMIFNLEDDNIVPKHETWTSEKLVSQIESLKNTIFIFEDFDVILHADNNFDYDFGEDNIKVSIKNILSSDLLEKQENLIFATANASEEITIPSQLRGFFVTHIDSSKDLPILESLGENITAKAKAGDIHKIVGRDEEIQELIDILSAKRYNNILLVGRPGVGKTTVIEGLAMKIANNEVPLNLRNVKIFDIPFTNIISDTGFTGSLECKIKNLVEEVRSHRKEVIVFFDEFHQLMCNETIRNALKPPLANGEFPLIGATTDDEYNRFVSGADEAFVQRFNRINIDELPEGPTIDIFKSIIKRESENCSYIDNDLIYLYHLCKKLNPLQALPRSGVKILGNILSKTGFNHHIDKNMIKESFSIGKISNRLLDNNEYDKISKKINNQIKGQDNQVEEILNKIKVHYFLMSKIERPLVMMFMGPTGVGKTQLTQEIATELWDSNRYLIFNMGSVSLKTNITGSPPGYVGYDQGSPIINFISANESGIIILDEFEKIGKKVEMQDAFLEIFDKGTTTDNKGKRVNCRPFIFVLTSNLGQDLTPEATSEEISKCLINGGFRKEFIGRLDLIKVFDLIDFKSAKAIIHEYLEEYNDLPEYECTFTITDDEIQRFLEAVDFKTFGARILKKSFDDHFKKMLMENREKLDEEGNFEIGFNDTKKCFVFN